MSYYKSLFSQGYIFKMLISYQEVPNFSLCPIVRFHISGTTGSGKTYFVKKLLQSGLIKCSRVYYFHPDLTEARPTDWYSSLPVDCLFKTDFPTVKDFKEMKRYSCIVLDDLMERVENSYDIDFLCRVLSRKLDLHVIIISQRYFTNNKYNLSIRNCCNYHVLMRNSDSAITKRIGRSLGHLQNITTCVRLNSEKLYPYIVIDKTNQARIHKLEVFLDIFSKIKNVVKNSMKYYLIEEKDFLATFKLKDSEIAEYEAPKQSCHKQKESTSIEQGSTSGKLDSSRAQQARRLKLQREIGKIIRRYRFRTNL